MKLPTALTTLLLTTLLTAQHLCQPMIDNACSNPEVHRYLVISEAQIERSKHLEYQLELFDTKVVVNQSHSGVTLSGNFSRLTLKNIQTKKETIYQGKQMVFKMPANHVFNLKKIPNLEIQIHHEILHPQQSNTTSLKYLMLSQTYMMTQFTSKVNTVLSHHIHRHMKNDDIIKTSQIVKVLKGYPMLMYRGSADSYPCRSDLLCFLKREYQLIGHEDFQLIQQFLKREPDSEKPKKAFKRKSLYEVYPKKQPQHRTTFLADQL